MPVRKFDTIHYASLQVGPKCSNPQNPVFPLFAWFPSIILELHLYKPPFKPAQSVNIWLLGTNKGGTPNRQVKMEPKSGNVESKHASKTTLSTSVNQHVLETLIPGSSCWREVSFVVVEGHQRRSQKNTFWQNQAGSPTP